MEQEEKTTKFLYSTLTAEEELSSPFNFALCFLGSSVPLLQSLARVVQKIRFHMLDKNNKNYSSTFAGHVIHCFRS